VLFEPRCFLISACRPIAHASSCDPLAANPPGFALRDPTVNVLGFGCAAVKLGNGAVDEPSGWTC
jgi:hypothetical protein